MTGNFTVLTPEEIARQTARLDAEQAVREAHVAEITELKQRIRELEEFIETIDHQHDAMQQIKAWCAAYPVDIFTPPDWVEAKEKLGGELLTRVSASNMRHVVDGITEIITQCEKNSTQ